MKMSLEFEVLLAPGGVRTKLGAAVEWRLYTGGVFTPVLVWVGACREAFVKGADYREVVAALLRAAAAKQAAALADCARTLGAEVSLDVDAIVTEFLPQICAELAEVRGVVEEITRPVTPPAVVKAPAAVADPPAEEKAV